jgi:hypothetical protein
MAVPACNSGTRTGVTGAARGWKHLARHAVMSAHIFCGHSGQWFCLVGLWQGISPAVDAATFEWAAALAIARAIGVVTGAISSAPSIVIIPRMTEQRWNGRLLMDFKVPCLLRKGKFT